MKNEYSGLSNSQLDRKLDLGRKIQSLKLEIDRNLKAVIEGLDHRKDWITERVGEIDDLIRELQEPKPSRLDDDQLREIVAGIGGKQDELDERVRKALDRFPKPRSIELPGVDTDLKDDIVAGFNDDISQSQTDLNSTLHVGETKPPEKPSIPPEDEKPSIVSEIKTDELHKLIHQSERWRGFMFAIGYELGELKKMKTQCEDATI